MTRALSISVRLHDGRYHGVSDWPPAPARLFQALVAGSACGAEVPIEDQAALTWLEALPAPIIAVPVARHGRGFSSYVPNNDIDAKGREPTRVDEIRTAKSIRPTLFDSAIPIGYHWKFADDDDAERLAAAVCRIADRLYQFGRGVDMAWAHAEVIEVGESERRLAEFPGVVHRPRESSGKDGLACPAVGSLVSLIARYAAQRQRLETVVVGRRIQQIFSQAPKPRFRQVTYGSPATFQLYDLMTPSCLQESAELTSRIRDAAVERLVAALPSAHGEIERVLIGRESTEADKASRVRILGLPSIGHPQADRAIRRILVEIPPNCPLRSDDIEWAFSGLNLETDESSGEVLNGLVKATDPKMLRHYGVEAGKPRLWRTVTAAALPSTAARRRIDPRRTREEAKAGTERRKEITRAAGAVLQALRHIDIRKQVLNIRVQREPFDAKGAMAGEFAPGSRFAKERLWHVEIEFADPVSGPLVIGDGRYVGLGLMAPSLSVHKMKGVHCLQILGGLADSADAISCASALRRAVMARVQEEIGKRSELPPFFTGHEIDGPPLRRGTHSHLAFVADLKRQRLLIVAPHVLEHRLPSEHESLRVLDTAVRGLTSLRAGDAGLLTLAVSSTDANDPLFAAARLWESATQYRLTRYAKRVTPQQALVLDVESEIRRLGLPRPEGVDVIEMREGPKGGLSGRVRLRFKTAVKGPLLLGKTSHFGGGLFARTD